MSSISTPAGACTSCGRALSPQSRFCPSCGAPRRDERGTEPVDSDFDRMDPDAGAVESIGQEFAGYRIEGLIARGGMGVVYRARQLRLDRPVALKLLAPELSHDERFRERFIAESRSAAAIDHPNLLPVYEAGEQGGVLFISARLVDGEDLKSLVRGEGPLQSERALAVLEQLASALDAAHAKGLVHRDVKLANVLIDRSGEARGREHCYLTDFGLSKRIGSDSGLTGTGQFVGTTDYVAPEQIQGRDLDGRTDQYSLGCLFYECLIGEVPFPREEAMAVLWAHVKEERPRVTDRRPELPKPVDDVIAMAMAVEPRERFATCGAFASAARSALHGKASAIRAAVDAPRTRRPDPAGGPRLHVDLPPEAPAKPRPPVAPRPPPQPATVRRVPPPPPQQPDSGDGRSRRWLAVLALLAAALLAGGLVAAALLLRSSNESAKANPALRARRTADQTQSLSKSVGDLADRIDQSGGPATPQPKVADQLGTRAAQALTLRRHALAEASRATGQLKVAYIHLANANDHLHKLAVALAKIAATGGPDAGARVRDAQPDSRAAERELRKANRTIDRLLQGQEPGPGGPPPQTGRRSNVELPDGTSLQVRGEDSGFGGHVAAAGDVNDDGKPDLIVGSWTAGGQARQPAYVLFGGKASGSVDVTDLRGSGFKIDAGSQSIDAVSPAGDFNGDKIDDIAVATNDFSSTRASWKTYIIFGSANPQDVTLGKSGFNGVEIDGGGAGMTSVNQLASVGDVNGDGMDDLAIAGETSTAEDAQVAVIFGGASGRVDVMSAGSWGFRITGATGSEAWVGGAATSTEMGATTSLSVLGRPRGWGSRLRG